MNQRMDTRKKKTDEELTENIGLPLTLLEKHDPWPAYVTYISPVVRRLIEKSQARELACAQALEERGHTLRQSKPSSIAQLRREKSSKICSNMMFKDTKPEALLSAWGASSVSATGDTLIPEPPHIPEDS